MAQWNGQYTGRTHESKIKEIESSLVKAIESYRQVGESEKNTQEKTVLKLCEKLNNARHKAIKARINKLSVPSSHHLNDLEALRSKEKAMEKGDLRSILLEFKLHEILDKI